MSVDAEIIETIDAVLGGDHTARIGQDAARIEELASRLRGSGLRGVRDRAGAGGRAAPARYAPRGHACPAGREAVQEPVLEVLRPRGRHGGSCAAAPSSGTSSWSTSSPRRGASSTATCSAGRAGRPTTTGHRLTSCRSPGGGPVFVPGSGWPSRAGAWGFGRRDRAGEAPKRSSSRPASRSGRCAPDRSGCVSR